MDQPDKGDSKASAKAEHEAEKVRQHWKDKSMLEALIYVCGILVVVGGLLLSYLGVSGGFTNQRILALWVLYFTLFVVLTGAFLYFYRNLRQHDAERASQNTSSKRPKLFIKSSKLYQPLGTSDRIEVEVWLANGGDADAVGAFSDISFRFDPSKPPTRLQYQTGAASIKFNLAPMQDTYIRLGSTLPLNPQMIKALNDGVARLYVFARGSYSSGERGKDLYPFPFCRIYHPTMPGNLIFCPDDVGVGETVGQTDMPAMQTPIKDRPSLIAESMVVTELAAAKIASVQVVFRNTGQTAARDVITHGVIWSAPVGDVDAPCPDIPPRPTLPFVSKSTVGPTGIVTVPMRTDTPLTSDQSEAIQNRLFWLYVYAIAEYEGTGGEKYLTEAYGRYNPVFRDFVKCDKRNRAT